MTETITREELHKAITASGVTLIEVLPEKYYNKGHISGALHMNYDEVDAKASTFLPNKEAHIVVYCASDTCSNSELAAKLLADRGYTHVRKYTGGKKDWVDAGLTLEV